MPNARILCFAGSLRRDSYNKRLVKIAMTGAEAAGADCTFIDLKEFALPVYDADIENEQGLPEAVMRLKKLMLEHNGFLIATPEYNSAISAALKNAIDWASRPAPGEAPLACFKGKVAGLMAASPGALGGIRVLPGVRNMLQNIGVMVVPEQIAVAKADTAFTADGAMEDKKKEETVKAIGAKVAKVARCLMES